ncbi:MAG: single-stranded-DNA-specific exonuclease RecJ [Myxococcales bacterium]|nr:MAG: single-stranded-DNA-specific exonuclease RecJ [Myxococcales bacterium]
MTASRPTLLWEFADIDEEKVRRLAAELDVRGPVARILVRRGLSDPEIVREHLSGSLSAMPDPFGLTGVAEAVRRIALAIERGEKIVAWGDYDVDGITSLSLLVRFFAQIPYPIEAQIPRRLEDGYGLGRRAVQELAARGAKLIVTVDNGIASVEEIELARSLGMDAIVVDHHMPENRLPEAAAIINPRQPACPFPHKDLAAVGLTFLLIAALRRHLAERKLLAREALPNLKELLDIVALGTIADLVPLFGLNRLFVRHGLPLLSRSTRPGVLALKEAARLDPDADIDAYAVAFQLAPRINAGGRIGDAQAGVKLLTTDSLVEARQQALVLEKRNLARRRLQETAVAEAEAIIEEKTELADAPVIVVGSPAWHEGIIGLVASKLVELHHKPSIVLAIGKNGESRASCRSIRALHIQEALLALSGRLVRFGGHAQAAGFTIETARIDGFREAFSSYVAARLTADDFRPRLVADGLLPLAEVDYALLDQLEPLAPFGSGYPEPVFVARGVTVIQGRVLKERHLKLAVGQDGRVLEAIGFGMAHHQLVKGDRLDIAFVPEYNTFRGSKAIQLRLRDLKRSEG